jgi:hypothetical protein
MQARAAGFGPLISIQRGCFKILGGRVAEAKNKNKRNNPCG